MGDDMDTDDKVKELLGKLERATRGTSMTWAVGGAMAMAARGVRRHTSDVDVFVADEDRVAMLRALRKVGLDVVPIFAPHHYVAKMPKETDFTVRIDVLVPADDPDVSAIHMATPADVDGHVMPVFTPEMLLLAKFYSDQPGAEDDMARMLHAGIVDVARARHIVEINNVDDARAFIETVARLSTAKPKRKRPMAGQMRRAKNETARKRK